MKKTNIAIVYFSGTGVTRTYAGVLAEALCASGSSVESLDVTAYADRQKTPPLERFDGVIFGFPVYSDFAPKAVNSWLPTLEGRGTRCSLFFTYGGRTTGYAHFHTAMLLAQAGFQLLLTSEFLGRHSLNIGTWRALPDRPNGQDLALARQFATLSLERFIQEEPVPLQLQKPFGYNHAVPALDAPSTGERHWAHPTRAADACSMCRLCETQCPTQAFNADAGLSDPACCISCLRCARECPEHVITLGAAQIPYEAFLKNWNITETMLNAKESKIITDFRQASC